MGFYECIENSVRAEEITRAEGEQLLKRFEGYRDRNGGGAAADAEAKKLLEREIRNKALNRKRRALLDARKMAKLDAFAENWRSGKDDKPNIGGAYVRALESFGDAPGVTSVRWRGEAIANLAMKDLEAGLDHWGPHFLSGKRKNFAAQDDIVAAAFFEPTKNKMAKQFFDAYDQVRENLRQRFNAEGGMIPKMEGAGGLPQNHNRAAVLKAGKGQWVGYIENKLDWERMRHKSGAVILPEERPQFLSDVWDAITTRGWSQREPSRQPQGRGALASQRADARFLHFKNAESWRSYQTDFGEGDVVHAMLVDIRSMANDIAALQVLGSNPDGMVRYMQQRVEKAASEKLDGTLRGYMREGGSLITGQHLGNVWMSMRGALDTPVHAPIARGFGAARDWAVASDLGSAAVSAVGDTGTGMMARAFNGIPVVKTFTTFFDQMRSSSRREVARAAANFDHVIDAFNQEARFAGTLSGPRITRYLADRTMQLSFLSPMTRTGRAAMMADTMGMFADNLGLARGELPAPMRYLLERYGVTDVQWDQLRRTKPYGPKGSAKWLRPADVEDPELAIKLYEILAVEAEYAVPNFSHRAKAGMAMGTQPGTLLGEIVRSGMMYKSYPATIYVLTTSRVGHEMVSGRPGRGAYWAFGALTMLTMWGALAWQLKQMVAGRDPQDITTMQFWGAAALQGGGLGIVGDFLFADLNRYGGGLPQTLAGPLIDRGQDFLNLTLGNAAQVIGGEETNAGREMVKMLRDNTPGSTIWYLRLAMERFVWDNLQRLADPEAEASFRRSMQNWQRNTGQAFFWQPGTNLPQRPPDLGAVVGGSVPAP